jgi:hypothetical protein
MKKVKLYLVLFLSSIVSCNTPADEDILTQNNIEEELKSTTWTVNYYLNNNLDETSDFSTYTLTFTNNGVLKASKPGTDILGSWIEDKVTKQIIINFDSNAAPFSKVSEMWRIHTKETGSIKFINNNETELFKIAKL